MEIERERALQIQQRHILCAMLLEFSSLKGNKGIGEVYLVIWGFSDLVVGANIRHCNALSLNSG